MSGVGGCAGGEAPGRYRWWLHAWALATMLDPRRRSRRARRPADPPRPVRSQRDFLYRRADDDPAEDQPDYRDSC